MTDAPQQLNIINNEAEGRWEGEIDGDMAVLEYQRQGNTIIYTHTGVPPAFRGQGYGEQLVKAALDDARAQGQQIVPLCPFVNAYLQRHRSYQDLVLKR